MAVSPRLFTRHDRGEFAPSYDQVTIGKGMADALQLDLGASVTLVSPTAGALADAIDGTVAGIVDASIPSFSSRIVFTDLALLQRVARLPKVYSELAIRLHKDTDMEAWVKTMQQKLDSHGVGENSVEVKGWWELEPIIRNVGEIIDGIVYLISFLLFAAAALSVTNMIYLIVVERIIEIGTLLAIGVRRKYIMALFAAEGLLTGGVSGGLGAFLGFSAIALMGWQGLEFPSPFGGDPIVIRPSPSAPIALAIWFIATIVCGLVAILPAARAAKVNPTEAYRGVV
jgi:putative ABC transport system permease protein